MTNQVSYGRQKMLDMGLCTLGTVSCESLLPTESWYILVICVLVHLINPFGMSRGHVFSAPRKVDPHEIQTGPGSSLQHHQSLGRWRDDATINAMAAAR